MRGFMPKSRSADNGKYRMVVREDWLMPACGVMADAERQAVLNRIRAMALRMGGNPYKIVERLTGVRRQAVYSMLRRAEMIAPDGKAYGYRASLPYLQINAKRPSRCGDHRWQRAWRG
ncbi:hypothetical protein ACTMU2_17050 [Cupriavidus basilensis]